MKTKKIILPFLDSNNTDAKIVKIFYENTKVPIITIPSNGWYLDKMDRQIKNMMECFQCAFNILAVSDGIFSICI